MKSTQTNNRFSIRIATSKDTTSLLELWKLCFTDDLDFLNFFFQEGFPLTRTYVLEKNGDIVAAASLFFGHYAAPARENDCLLPISYLYGVCTHPDHQKQGLSSQLIQHIIQDRKANNDAFVLTKPANPDLFPFYQRLGFTQPIYGQKRAWFPEEHTNGPMGNWVELTGEKLQELYAYESAKLAGSDPIPRIVWNTPTLNYILNYYRKIGGFACQNGYGHCIGTPDGQLENTTLLLECTTKTLPVEGNLLEKFVNYQRGSGALNDPISNKNPLYALAYPLFHIPNSDTHFPFPME